MDRTVERYFALYPELAQRGWAETDTAEHAPRHSTLAFLEIEEVTTARDSRRWRRRGRPLAPRARATVPVAGLADPLVARGTGVASSGWRLLAAQSLVGLLPMYLQHDGDGGKLLPLGIAISGYLDGLFEEGMEVLAAETMLRHLAERDDWRRYELHPLRSGSPLLAARRRSGCADEILAFEPCLVVGVPPGRRELKDVLPSKIRENLGYFRGAPSGSASQLRDGYRRDGSEFVEALFRLHDARWQQLGQPGVLADPAIRRFHRAAAPLLHRAGLLRLHALRLDERIVAVMYAMAAKRRTYCYLCGFDPEFAALPGTLIFGYSMWQAVREGARRSISCAVRSASVLLGRPRAAVPRAHAHSGQLIATPAASSRALREVEGHAVPSRRSVVPLRKMRRPAAAASRQASLAVGSRSPRYDRPGSRSRRRRAAPGPPLRSGSRRAAAPRDRRVRHGVDREHGIERAVGERREIAPEGLDELHVREPRAALPRRLEHAGRNIGPGDRGHPIGKRPLKTSDAATDIENAPFRPDHGEPIEQLDDLARCRVQQARFAQRVEGRRSPRRSCRPAGRTGTGTDRPHPGFHLPVEDGFLLEDVQDERTALRPPSKEAQDPFARALQVGFAGGPTSFASAARTLSRSP